MTVRISVVGPLTRAITVATTASGATRDGRCSPLTLKFLHGPHRVSPRRVTTQDEQKRCRQAAQVCSEAVSSWLRQKAGLIRRSSRRLGGGGPRPGGGLSSRSSGGGDQAGRGGGLGGGGASSGTSGSGTVLLQGTRLPKPQSQKTSVPDRLSARP